MELHSTEEIVADIKAGKMVVLMDDEDRENEGDLIIAAEAVTPEAVNFMARFGRGLICLTLTEQRCKQLNLPLMVANNQEAQGTNFTLSIEAAQGVTTGISAADRAITVQAAVAKSAVPNDIVMPGHVFPLMAQPGGVLTRAGHTEAGCDLARLAGMEPASVIVEILNEDGTMARRPDLEVFAKAHGLKIGTVADLIEYRVRNEKTVERVTESNIHTKFGDFRVVAFQESIGGETHLALVKGKVSAAEPVLIRVHMLDTLCDLFSVEDALCGRTLQQDMVAVSKEENAVLVVLRKDKDEDLVHKIMLHGQSQKAKTDANYDRRMFGVGAQILADLGVGKMRVLGTPAKYHGLSGFGLEVVEHVPYKKA